MTTADLPLIETAISQQSIRIRFADHVDAAKATGWIDVQVPLSDLTRPAIHDPERAYVAEVRLAALRAVRERIGAETQRLEALAGPSR